MSLAAEKNEQSMEDILSSIRKIISEEDQNQHPSSVLEDNAPASDEEPLVLTKIIHDDDNVVSLKETVTVREDAMAEQTEVDAVKVDETQTAQVDNTEEAMTLQEEQMVADVIEEAPVADELQANPEVTEETSAQDDASAVNNMDDVVSSEALTQAAAALSSLSKLGPEQAKSVDPVGGQTVENLMREVLRPLLREWIDANLPSMVRVVVNEHVERIVRQMGHDTSTSEKTEDVQDAS